MNRPYGFLSSTHILRYLINNATLGRIEYGIIKINLHSPLFYEEDRGLKGTYGSIQKTTNDCGRCFERFKAA